MQQLGIGAGDGRAGAETVQRPGLGGMVQLQLVVGGGEKAAQDQACGLRIGQPQVFTLAQHQHGLVTGGQWFGLFGLAAQDQPIAPRHVGWQGLGLAGHQLHALGDGQAFSRSGLGQCAQGQRDVQPQALVRRGSQGRNRALSSNGSWFFGGHIEDAPPSLKTHVLNGRHINSHKALIILQKKLKYQYPHKYAR